VTISAPLAPPPQQFSSEDGSLQGVIDGVNAAFLISAFLTRARVYRNGVMMTLNVDCVAGGRSILFLRGQIPQPGDVVTVQGYMEGASAPLGFSPTFTADPVFTPASGSVVPFSVTISCATAGATIYYTTNGSTPTTASPVYTAPIALTSALTIKALATAPGRTKSFVTSASYTIVPVADPVFTPASGSVPLSVVISCATVGATIYYTTDGSTPTTASSVYAAPIALTSALTIKAFAAALGHTNSSVTSSAYTILPSADPAFTPASGSVPLSVVISCATAGATIYYTTDGSAPTTASPVYTGPIALTSALTIKAFAAALGHTNSSVTSSAYTILPSATPVFTPASGSIVPLSVTITCATAGATIYYTMDGSTPTTGSTLYTGPVSVPVGVTIKAIATAPAHLASAVAAAVYLPIPTVATPTFSPVNGTELFNPPQNITISSATAGATIYYTTDGSAPTKASLVYTGPIAISVATTIQALADKTGMSTSPVATAAYTFGITPPPPVGATAVLFQKTGPSTDSYYNAPSDATKAFINAHLTRIMYYTGFGEPRLSWSPPAWCYKDSSSLKHGYIDSSGVYHPQDDPLVASNPTWVLRDSGGNPTYLTWGCTGGSCPQYMPNFQDAGFLSHWLSQASPLISAGYRGLFIDDANLDISASNGSTNVVPIDPSTSAPITQSNWGLYLCQFIEAVRAAFPGSEIVINALWFNGNSNPAGNANYRRLIQAADWFNMERGFDDNGITGGTGRFSLRQLFSVIDQIHGLGRNFISQNLGVANSDFYPLACYLNVAQGNDLFCQGFDLLSNWAQVDYIALGTPTTDRYDWNGLIRRDYTDGTVLVCEPGGSGGGSLGKTYTDPNGNLVSSVSLTGRTGAILQL
jgi:ABC-type cobalt transport system substrate-binding protein